MLRLLSVLLTGTAIRIRTTRQAQLDSNYWVYISNGQTTISFAWQVHYQSSAANNPVSSTAVTSEGTYRVYDNKSFDVLVDDKDLDGVCTWKVDGTLVMSCNTYKYTQADAAEPAHVGIQNR